MRIHQLLLLASGLLGAGCQKEEAPAPPIVTFEVVHTMHMTVDPLTTNPEFYLATRAITSATTARACEQNKTTVDRIQSAALSTATVTITAPNGQNFDYLRRFTLQLVPAQGNNRVVLATTGTIPRGATTLTLEPTTQDMTSTLKSREYYVAPYLEVHPQAAAFAQLQAQLTYRVQAQQL